MEWVVVERNFPEALTPDLIRHTHNEECFTLYGVKPVRSYLAAGGKRLVCIFRAPDAEAVRVGLRNGGSPPATVWTGTLKTP